MRSSPLGTTEITLTVDDGRGATASDTVAIEVFDPPPVVALHHLEFIYSGQPMPATVETYPEGLPVEVLYNGEPTPPIYPGAYTVVATVLDPDHPGSVSGTLIIRPTVFVRHGPVLNGTIDGSIQVARPEDVTVNGNGAISGDLLVPGMPYVHLNGSPTYGGTLQGPGEATPT